MQELRSSKIIHYHGTPCGGKREEVARFLSGRHALIPWIRNEDINTAATVCQSFILDNGAFSFWRTGQKPNWENYYVWVREWMQHPSFDWALIPDVIDGDEKENDELLWAWPLQQAGVPVWHMHESLDRLARLCDNWQRVAIGSSGMWGTPGTEAWWTRINDAMKVACDEQGRPKAKLHGLRMLNPEIFTRLPLSSADSTNAAQNSSSYSRFGIYAAPNAGTRMHVIAERIEAHQSAPTWVQSAQQKFCFDDVFSL